MSVINFAGDAWVSRVDEGNPRDNILRIAAGLARTAKGRDAGAGGAIYVGYDTRGLSCELAQEVAGVIAGQGVRARLSETYCPTAAVCGAARNDPDGLAALMLTADSRSADYVGARIRMADGSPASSADADELEANIPAETPVERGTFELADIVGPFKAAIASFIDVEAIRSASPTVVCDAMYGAGRGHAADVLAKVGVQVVEVRGEGDPDFGGIHPEAAEPWIDECEQAVPEHGASFGISIDGAADRIALIDERGRPVTPHLMLALIMEHLVRVRGIRGRMVAPIFVSTVVRRQAERLGMPLTVTSAGYLWLREEMAAGDVACAGDALGGICIPAIDLERDAIAVAALLCEIVARANKPLSQLVSELDAELGHMEYGRRDVRLGSGAVQVLRNALPGVNPPEVAGMRPREVSHPGGVMLRFENGSWLMVRPSRSFSVARVYAEAPSPADRDALLAAGSELACSPLG